MNHHLHRRRAPLSDQQASTVDMWRTLGDVAASTPTTPHDLSVDALVDGLIGTAPQRAHHIVANAELVNDTLSLVLDRSPACADRVGRAVLAAPSVEQWCSAQLVHKLVALVFDNGVPLIASSHASLLQTCTSA